MTRLRPLGPPPGADLAPPAAWRPSHQGLPGFGVSLGITLTYLTLLVLAPLLALVLRASAIAPGEMAAIVLSPRSLAAFRFSFEAAATAAAADAVLGALLSWVLVRYRFPGHHLANALVDVPLALPTAVAGVALTWLYSPGGPLGGLLSVAGVQVAFARPGVVLALAFVGLPFAVRSVQPVLADLDASIEEAAATLGAGRLQILRRVLLPALTPALLTGFALAFARALGEYGSVVFISGNLPFRTEIVPLLIATRLDQFDYRGATAIAAVMLAASFLLLLVINLLRSRSGRFRS